MLNTSQSISSETKNAVALARAMAGSEVTYDSTRAISMAISAPWPKRVCTMSRRMNTSPPQADQITSRCGALEKA
ncbi:hypothetical protein D3C76_1819130 [compost metagenome]